MENYTNGAYPFGKTFYFVLGAKKSPAGERFLAFLRSPKGVAALRKAGVLPENRMRSVGITQNSLRTFVTAIGLFLAIITAVSIPAGYLFVEYSAAANNLSLKAQLKANRLAKYIYIHSELWQYQAVRLAEAD